MKRTERPGVSGAEAGQRFKRKTDYRMRNLDQTEWWIPKVQIELENQGKRDRYMGYIKRNTEEDWLVSLRNRTGVEGFRLLLTKDSVYIIDRFKRQLLYGDMDRFLSEFGLERKLLSLCIGDIPDIHFQLSQRSDTSRYQSLYFMTGRKYRMTGIFDRIQGKMIEYQVTMAGRPESLKFTYSDFISYENGIVVPSGVSVYIPERDWRLSLRIMDVRAGEFGKWSWSVKDSYEHVPIR